MFFNRRKPTESFKKEKITQQALDNFAQNYSANTGTVKYKLKSGKEIQISIANIIQSKNGLKHYQYLLGQIAPYHIPTQDAFPLTYAAYILDEKKQLVPWCTDSTVLSQFVTIGQELGYIILEQGPNNTITFERSPGIKPIIHEDKARGERND